MKEILILGAGYTGMGATMSLAGRLKGRDDVHITLVNPQTRFTERLRLHQTASGRARNHIQARRPRFETDRAKKRAVTEQFFAASTGGDINGRWTCWRRRSHCGRTAAERCARR